MYVGIDIGSTASKAVMMDQSRREIVHKTVIPSGWNSKETAETLLSWAKEYSPEFTVTATGYGRVSVDFANKTVTEISCHAAGAYFLAGRDVTVIDIGGQDTKVIAQKNGKVQDFLMNDKCSAGTGKFLEVMANRLGLSLAEMFACAERGNDITLSSTCTVFAESEVISLMGRGTPREDIARGVINRIVEKTVSLVSKRFSGNDYFLTGGFCESAFLISLLAAKLNAAVYTSPLGRFAGAIGACLLGNTD